jgi:restriction endonuclease-like protein/putative AbiEi antitoxin of type IV toxin-antitoxin system
LTLTAPTFHTFSFSLGGVVDDKQPRAVKTTTTLDHATLALAATQHWVVTREQVERLGLSRSAIAHRLQSGWLHPFHRGVYAVGRPQLDERGRWHAAVLASGPDAVLSHRSAATLWGLIKSRHSLVDVTVPGGGRRRRRGIWVRRTRVLTAADATIVDGIPVTSVARTIVDFAGLFDERSLIRVVEQAQRIGRLDVGAVSAAAERVRGRRGLGRVRRVLAAYTTAPPVRSDFERDFLDLIAGAGLPRPQINAIVEGLEVDVFWPQFALIVELDGRAYHSDPTAFERDPVRDARLQRAGYRVLRVTYRRFTDRPASVIDDIRALAGLGPPAPAKPAPFRR